MAPRWTALRSARFFSLLAIVAGVAVLPACRTPPTKVDYARRYPKDAVQGEVLNIQVVRHNTEIEFTNTTGHSFGPCTLWLNSRFSRPLDGVKIGQTIRLPLKEFRDEFSDSFRGGGFFATDLPERLVRAQLEVPAPAAAPVTGEPAEGQPHAGPTVFLGLIVVGGAED